MTAHSSYILNQYSFIYSLSDEQILKIGVQSADGRPIPSFDQDLLINLCKDAENLFANEANVLEIKGDVIVVGDIHGSFHDLIRILKYIEDDKSKVIFLGDYVDRGNFSLECITLLFALKVLNPDNYFLLRGNHEFDAMCSQYGFKKEILNYHNPKKINITKKNEQFINTNEDINFDLEEEEKEEEEEELSNEALCDSYYANHVNMNCYKYNEKLYDAFISAFSYLPISAIVNNTSICLHGGLTPLLDKIENIQKIQRPISDFDENLLLSDITWGDPSSDITHLYGHNQRGRGHLFSGAAVVNFLKNNNLKRIIRGHECVLNGTLELFNDKCITVFSASSYSGDMTNCSGILKIHQDTDEYEPIHLHPIHRLNKYDAHYFKVQSFNQTQEHKSMFSVCNKKITEYKSGFFPSFLNLNALHSDPNFRSQSHINRQLSLDETELNKGFLSNQSIGIRKSKNIINKMPILKTGPRKKIGTNNLSIGSKNPLICTPGIPKHKSHGLILDSRRKCVIADNDGATSDESHIHMDVLRKIQM